MKEKFLHLYEHNFQVELQTNNHVNQLSATYGHKLHLKTKIGHVLHVYKIIKLVYKMVAIRSISA
jgi:hypothetical protein